MFDFGEGSINMIAKKCVTGMEQLQSYFLHNIVALPRREGLQMVAKLIIA
jgi:hypothetical protein